jgi:hypothetical protein
MRRRGSVGPYFDPLARPFGVEKQDPAPPPDALPLSGFAYDVEPFMQIAQCEMDVAITQPQAVSDASPGLMRKKLGIERVLQCVSPGEELLRGGSGLFHLEITEYFLVTRKSL